MMDSCESVCARAYPRDHTHTPLPSFQSLRSRLWDVPTGICLATLPHPTSSPTTSIHFSPSSSHLLASSLDSTIRLWDIVNGKVVKTYRPDKANGKAFQNNKVAIKSHFVTRPETSAVYIVSGSEDCKVYFWNLQSRRIPDVGGTLVGHRDIVGAVAVHPTKAIVASASFEHDLSIKVRVRGGGAGDGMWTRECRMC